MPRIQKYDKTFYRTILMIAIPVIIQNLISIGLNMADTIMIGRLGVDELAAVGTANRFYMLFSTICFGCYSGAAIYVSQYWGAKDIPSIRKVMGIEITLGTIFSTVFLLSALFFAPEILLLFTRDAHVIELGKQYLYITVFSYFFTSMSFAINFNSRAIHNLKVPTIINTIALFINLGLNYLLIFGKMGFPKLGVVGAAIATLTARVLEFTMMVLFIYRSDNHPLAASVSELLSYDKIMIKKVLSKAFPVILSESAWSLGNTMHYIAYGLIGPTAIAVMQVASTVNELFQAAYFGVGNASSIMIGNELGRRNTELAYDYGKTFLKMTVVLNIITSMALYFARGMIIQVYDFDMATNLLLSQTLVVYAVYMTPKMMGYVFSCGILRAGGDTKFSACMDIIATWCIGVPMAFIGVLVFKLELPIVASMVFTGEWIIAIGSFIRFRSKKWMHILVD